MKLRTKSHKKLIIATIIGIVVLGGAAYGAYYFINQNNRAHTTSKAATAQDNYSSGDAKKSATSSDSSQGGATDNSGKTSASGTGISSESGLIAVTSPTKSATFASGDELSGTSQLSLVQFRVVDDAIGVIAQGQLSVVGGKFSGTLHFQPRSNSGKVVVFSFDAQGREANSIDIPVVLK